jgi:hypothetical protein
VHVAERTIEAQSTYFIISACQSHHRPGLECFRDRTGYGYALARLRLTLVAGGLKLDEEGQKGSSLGGYHNQ